MSRKVPLVDLRKGYLAHRNEIDSAIRRVLDSGWYILGPEVTAFESAFAKNCGAKEAIGVGNGTDAIVIALRALDIGEGDVVFTVSHTAVATVAAIEMTGAKPVLIDIDPKTYTIDPQKLETTVERFAGDGKPRAVIAVHLYGQPCDIDAISAICRKYDLNLIEDCAQAHGATYKGNHVGTYGAISTFSFYPTKNLGAFGDGGAIITHDPNLAERCRALRQYGWHKHYISDLAGMNSRLDEMHAAILNVRLQYLHEEIASRRNVAKIYNESLAEHVTIPSVRPDCEHAYHLYVIRSGNRDDLRAKLQASGIGCGIHYPQPIHLQNAYKHRIGLGFGGMEETELAATQILSLPMHGFLEKQDIDAIIDAVVG